MLSVTLPAAKFGVNYVWEPAYLLPSCLPPARFKSLAGNRCRGKSSVAANLQYLDTEFSLLTDIMASVEGRMILIGC
jgi:hypothetical protein